MDKYFTGESLTYHYARLYWGCNWAQCHEGDESVEWIEDGYDHYCIPKGLRDEDKFLCAILNCEEGRCINSDDLKTMFEWTRYKSKKTRKKIPHIITVACICENGGYGGHAWTLDTEMTERLKEIQIRQHHNCAICAKVQRYGEKNFYSCPISREVIAPSQVSYRHCKYEKLEVGNVFNKVWD